MDNSLPAFATETLLDAFRTHYHRFAAAVANLVSNPTDATVIARLGDDLDEYTAIYQDAVDSSHQGRPVLVQTIPSDGPGRPRIYIDPDFLQWAYGQRSTAGIARFLGVGRTTVRNALLSAGIAEHQPSPFPIPMDFAGFPPDVEDLASAHAAPTSFTGPVSGISDDELDTLLIRLRTHYKRAGLSMLNGMLRRLGHRVPTDRVRSSLLRIDPVRRIFERIRIRRRDYRVLGPNSLWHHDGQHGVSVHNVRIERLWVDITAQVGAAWADRFVLLELRHGLDINNTAHIWLLHILFLGTINSQLAFFAEAWNQHRIQIRNGPNRSPTDMFVFDMYVNGVRGNQLPVEEEGLGDDELEVYGIDWQGLRDDSILDSQRQNNPRTEGSSSWVGRVGPPPDLSEVVVDPPAGTLSNEEVDGLQAAFSGLIGSADEDDIVSLWSHALAYVRVLHPDVF
ncbi:hypothetical protein C8F04DRAFT_966270 [Mycena alexandri]|uniref:Integrase core domain-containing protein n=1 Tax=Mycena alexandri TaxID=1745969 RepID=A0AAD6SI67_9AGAR|nr:hypothetical protein C8F04DRAFT_966270 [Mycena alexandri]